MSISSVNGVASTVSRYRFVAAGGETSLTGSDANGATLSYLVGKEEVYLNGALLVRGQDYTGTDGATISSLTALVAGDTVEIITFVPFAIPTAISSATVTTKGDLIVATGASAVTRVGAGTDGQFLTAASTASTGLTWSTVSIPSAVSMNEQIFTSSGTWTAPTGVTKVWLIVVGGGGGGGSRGSNPELAIGGSGGAQTQQQLTVIPGTGYTVTIGGGGGVGGSGGVGYQGGTTTIGSVSALGGTAGTLFYPSGTTGAGDAYGQSSYGIGGASSGAAGAANTGGGGAGGSTGGAGGSGIVIVRWLA